MIGRDIFVLSGACIKGRTIAANGAYRQRIVFALFAAAIEV